MAAQAAELFFSAYWPEGADISACFLHKQIDVCWDILFLIKDWKPWGVDKLKQLKNQVFVRLLKSLLFLRKIEAHM